MAHIPGDDRSQQLLLPDAVDDWVGADNPVRFIDAFVDGLDLERAGFERVQANRTGRPGYDPADLLKLYLYGYLNRIRSSRRLEAETHRNLEVIWLLRRLRPDFKTIADFRRDNREAFRQVFLDFVGLCRELDLYGRELLAVDGTRIKAVNNVNRNFTRAKLERELNSAEERLERYLRQMDEADADDAGGGAVVDLEEKIAALRERRATLREYRDKLEESGRGQLSLTDPASRAMSSGKGPLVGYNVQIAVDAKHSLIAEQQVYNNLNDFGLLAQTAVAARENLAVDKIDAVADKGYYKIDDIEACEAGGVTPYVPKPVDRSPMKKKGLFTKSRFRYDGATDSYACPSGHRLRPTYFHQLAGGTRIQYVNRKGCRNCRLRPFCTADTHRRISRYANETILERMAERLAARPDLLVRRGASVEHPFGSIKQWMSHGAFLTRQLENVRGEFSLTALAYNMRRALNLVGVPALVAAATA